MEIELGVVSEEISSREITSTSVSWHNINVFAKPVKKIFQPDNGQVKKHIIKSVSGNVVSGQLLAIMGSSGSGKTTLLNVLTSRDLRNLRVEGVVRYNGHIVNKNDIGKIGSYIYQSDLFIPRLTVREHLNFQALLRLGQNTTKEQRNEHVDDIINELGLSKCCDTRIGSNTTFKGISGGEMKRLAFASELITNPSILFCDEPTSNLDSFMAENIVSIMKSMASKGRTIICTIHQPSSHVFEMFDQILLLTEGRVAYMGDRDGALDFFSSIGLVCLKKFNPADFYIKELSMITDAGKQSSDKITRICDQFVSSKYNTFDETFLQPVNELSLHQSFNDNLVYDNQYKSGFCRQLLFLSWRNILDISRNVGVIRYKLCQAIIMALVIGIVYYRQKPTNTGVSNINGVLYLLMGYLAMMSFTSTIQIFTVGIHLNIREYRNNMYGINAYYLSNVLAQVPLITLLPVIFACVYYYIIGLNSYASVFGMHLVIVILASHTAASLGYFLSSISLTPGMANILMMPIFLTLSLFGGLFINSSTFPAWLDWAKYLSFYHYTYELMLINQWKTVSFLECNSTVKCFNNGQDVIEYYGFNQDDFALNFGILLTLTITSHILAFIFIHIKVKIMNK